MGIYRKTTINRVIKGTTFWTDHKKYAFIKLDKSTYRDLLQVLARRNDEYVEVIYDRKELTIIIAKDTWERELERSFKPQDTIISVGIISCDVLESTVTGYLLELLRVISTNNIGVYVQGSYTSDHIFVDYPDLDRALEYLNELKRNI